MQQSSGPLSSVGTYPLGSVVGAAVVGAAVVAVTSDADSAPATDDAARHAVAGAIACSSLEFGTATVRL